MQRLSKKLDVKLDPWAASSLLQKSIRRGQTTLAQFSGQTLFRQRGVAVWRRLIGIAVEDIGIGDVELTCEMATVGTNKELRQTLGGDEELIQHYCQKLAEAVKDRSTDYLYCASLKLPVAMDRRALLSSKRIDEQIDVALDSSKSLMDRTIASFAVAGISGTDTKLHSSEGLEIILQAFVGDIPEPLSDCIRAIAKLKLDPLVLTLPLLATAWDRNSDTQTFLSDHVPPSRAVAGIPLWAFDKHTRIGKQAVTLFAAENEDVRETLANYVPPSTATKVALIASFYLDGHIVTRRLNWVQSSALEALGIEADMVDAGCPVPGIEPVLQAVRRNADHLNAIRERVLSRQVRND